MIPGKSPGRDSQGPASFTRGFCRTRASGNLPRPTASRPIPESGAVRKRGARSYLPRAGAGLGVCAGLFLPSAPSAKAANLRPHSPWTCGRCWFRNARCPLLHTRRADKRGIHSPLASCHPIDWRPLSPAKKQKPNARKTRNVGIVFSPTTGDPHAVGCLMPTTTCPWGPAKCIVERW